MIESQDNICREITVYIPELQEFLYASEGTGDNLLQEDIDEGYVDYVYIETYSYEGGCMESLVEEEGGQMLLKEPFDKVYTDHSGEKLLADAMKFIYDKKFDFVRIEPKKEN